MSTTSEEPVAEFYRPVMADRPTEVQRLVVNLLRGEFKLATDLEARIMAVAQSAAQKED